MNEFPLTRRRFLGSLAVAGAVAPVLMNVPASARAEDLPRLEESDPTAQALMYRHDAATVDQSDPRNARFEPGQNCANCAYIGDDEGAEWLTCTYFPQKLVNAEGWCSIWAPKA